MNKICPSCKQTITDEIDKEFLFNVGECTKCDHMRSDISPHLEYPGVSSQPVSPEVQIKIDNDQPF